MMLLISAVYVIFLSALEQFSLEFLRRQYQFSHHHLTHKVLVILSLDHFQLIHLLNLNFQHWGALFLTSPILWVVHLIEFVTNPLVPGGFIWFFEHFVLGKYVFLRNTIFFWKSLVMRLNWTLSRWGIRFLYKCFWYHVSCGWLLIVRNVKLVMPYLS